VSSHSNLYCSIEESNETPRALHIFSTNFLHSPTYAVHLFPSLASKLAANTSIAILWCYGLCYGHSTHLFRFILRDGESWSGHNGLEHFATGYDGAE
jgi:hypothetical protein